MRTGVVGAGVMGRDIAGLLADGGHEVTLVDVDPDALDAVRTYHREDLPDHRRRRPPRHRRQPRRGVRGPLRSATRVPRASGRMREAGRLGTKTGAGVYEPVF